MQLARLVHASAVALRKTSLLSKYRKQFSEVDMSTDYTAAYEEDVDAETDLTTVAEADDDVDVMNEAIADEVLSDERVEEMGLSRLISESLEQPEEATKCSLSAIECGRNKIRFQRGVTGLHAVTSSTSGVLVLMFTDRKKDKLRGSARNGSRQKLIIETGSLWSAWITTPSRSPARLHLSLSSAPPCLHRMWVGNDDWVRHDERRVLEECSTCNLIVLHGDENKLQKILAMIRKQSPLVKRARVRPMSYRLPALVARAESYHEKGQQKRIANKGAGLFVQLKKAKTTERRQELNRECTQLYRRMQYRWQLYLRTCWGPTFQSTTCPREKKQREYRLPCMSCGLTTFWDKHSGIRRGLDLKSHHFCKKLIDFDSESFKRAPWLKLAFFTRVLNRSQVQI